MLRSQPKRPYIYAASAGGGLLHGQELPATLVPTPAVLVFTVLAWILLAGASLLVAVLATRTVAAMFRRRIGVPG